MKEFFESSKVVFFCALFLVAFIVLFVSIGWKFGRDNLRRKIQVSSGPPRGLVIGAFQLNYSINQDTSPEIKLAFDRLVEQFAITAGRAYAAAEAYGRVKDIEDIQILKNKNIEKSEEQQN